MGRNTYYGLGAPTEDQVKKVADHLVGSGLRDSGHNIVGGTLTDAPTVAFAGPDDWTLFARGADGRLWSRGPASG
ncbi:hypothetical protein [Streptomyces chiangmaiensis]|uniref:Uncharacterized protein n=1 Tax=Streptomyces chiangmaiensis TaxID=766497 RepID=A0ABU7FSD2_9ACTN|nr:hypothetical protein [Streptomyces chiangmaiensis]MED7827021.1 hypothetical protein [Streptomyces chiangmaiensis]